MANKQLSQKTTPRRSGFAWRAFWIFMGFFIPLQLLLFRDALMAAHP
jgi:hypothetical protein